MRLPSKLDVSRRWSMPKRVDRTGLRFGRLVVVAFSHRGVRRDSHWLCRCDCGKSHVVVWGNLRSGDISSCGCWLNEVRGESTRTHGMSRTRVYRIWKAMVKRCENPNGPKWHRYGGRGISVDPAWRNSFEQFFADMGHPPDGLSIERKDNDAGYSKGNCVWATAKEQARNKSDVRFVEAFGKRQTIPEWAAEFGLSRQTIAARLRAGVSGDIAVSATVVSRKSIGRPPTSTNARAIRGRKGGDSRFGPSRDTPETVEAAPERNLEDA